MSQSISKERIRVLDVVRGLTMTLVVFHHVRGSSFGLYNSPSTISELLVAFRMPMFFFISGFVASKCTEVWTARYAWKRTLTKARVELVPTVVFFCLFMCFSSWSWTFPGGYWFTLALFAMLASYYVISALCRRFCPGVRTSVILTIGIALYALMPSLRFLGADIASVNEWFPCGKCCEFFIFFAAGTVLGADKLRFLNAISSNKAASALLITAVISLGIVLRSNLNVFGDSALRLAGSASLIALILACFWRSRNYWNAGGRISRAMNFVGRRTLDIYMLHWFLLPSFPQFRSIFWHKDNGVAELAIIGAVSVAVVCVCLVLSQLIRTSPLAARWLFGVSAPKQPDKAAKPAAAREFTEYPLPRKRTTMRSGDRSFNHTHHHAGL